MKILNRVLLSAFLAFGGLSLSHATQNPKWLSSAAFYQIYPSSFMDTNGDGYGDLPGITQKLDYIQGLGCNALWLNPVFLSGWTDGGYDVIDYYKIDPRFGTNTDMVKLAEEAHKRGMKVCLDLVAGHSSDQCEWFKQSAQAANEHYSDYYIWFDQADEAIEKEGIITMQEWEDMQNGKGKFKWGRYVQADAPRAKYYEKNFYPTQPALNYGYYNINPNHPWEQPVTAPGPQATRRELRNIMQFWFDKGIDGFRVDMAASLVKNDPDKVATIALWQEMREWVNTNYPECVLISEWGSPTQSIPAGFNIDFMIHIGVPGYGSLFFEPGTPYEERSRTYEHCYFDKAGKGILTNFVENFTNSYSKTRGEGYIAIPTANHDYQRPNIGTRNTMDQLKVTQTFFLTMPGVPFIYYGDEIGMKYLMNLPPKEGSNTRAGTRTPMQWGNDDNAGFSTAPAEKLYFPVDTEQNTLTVETQEKDPNSLLNYTRQLLKFRHDNPGLENDADWELLSDVNQPYPMIYKRSDGKQTFIVVLNPSGKKVTAVIPAQGQVELVIGEKKSGTYKSGKAQDKITVNGITAQIYQMK